MCVEIARNMASCRDCSGKAPRDVQMDFQAKLGPAQITILRGLANGLSPRQLAADLGFSEHTVTMMLRCARDVLGARSEIQAVIFYDRQASGR